MKKIFYATMLVLFSLPAYAEEEACKCQNAFFSHLNGERIDFIIEAKAIGPHKKYEDWNGMSGSRFAVNHIWEGPKETPKEIVVDGLNKDNSCSIQDFKQGENYLLGGKIVTWNSGKSKRWWVSPCYGTNTIDKSTKELELLKMRQWDIKTEARDLK